jgi:hypothetical protein
MSQRLQARVNGMPDISKLNGMDDYNDWKFAKDAFDARECRFTQSVQCRLRMWTQMTLEP